MRILWTIHIYVHLYTYINIYIGIHTCIFIYIYIYYFSICLIYFHQPYIYIYRERERETHTQLPRVFTHVPSLSLSLSLCLSLSLSLFHIYSETYPSMQYDQETQVDIHSHVIVYISFGVMHHDDSTMLCWLADRLAWGSDPHFARGRAAQKSTWTHLGHNFDQIYLLYHQVRPKGLHGVAS